MKLYLLPGAGLNSGPEKGVISKGVFSLEESLASLNSLNSLESLEDGRLVLCFPQSGGSLKSLESLNSLESLENGLCLKRALNLTRLQLGPFFVLKFVRSRVLGARFLRPFPKSLVTEKCDSNTKLAVNSRMAVNGR